MMEIVNGGRNKYIPYIKIDNVNRIPNNIWWDEEYSEQNYIRKQALAIFQNFPSTENVNDAKKIILYK